MTKVLLGKKIGMTQVFDPDGRLFAVTVIQAGKCVVTQVKTVERDGYDAIQLGYDEANERKLTKPLRGHCRKSGELFFKHFKEFKMKNVDNFAVGGVIKVDVFEENELVDVIGISKGHGFCGTVKRWGTHRGPMSHGSGYHRGVGSMGSSAKPARVMKGKKLPGHLGVDRVTVQNLAVVKVDVDNGLLIVKGGVPGINGSFVFVRDAVKACV